MKSSRGYTLIELMVATVLMAIAVSLVFYSWNFASRRMTAHQRKTAFQYEANRLAYAIVTEIRRSPEVIAWDKSGISFLSPEGVDTIRYGFDGENLEKNGNAVQCLCKGGRVTRFTLEKNNSNTTSRAASSDLLLITLGMEDGFGNKSTIPLMVKDAFVHDPANASQR